MAASDRMVVLGCAHSAGIALGDLRAGGRDLPAGVEWVDLSCGGGLDELHLLRAFESGADRVLVLTCSDSACRSVQGNRWAEKRVLAARRLLEEAGIAGWRVAFDTIAPTMAADLLSMVEAFASFAPTAQMEAATGEDTP